MRLLAILACLLGAVLASVVLAGPARAVNAPIQVCGTNYPAECLNDRNNGGFDSAVEQRPQNTNTSNNYWWPELLTGRCNHGYTTSSCPGSGNPAGLAIVQVVYGNNNSLCLATSSGGYAITGWCNNPGTGTGGSNGTVLISDPGGCAHGGALISHYWTGNNWGNRYGLFGDNVTGDQWYWSTSPQSCMIQYG